MRDISFKAKRIDNGEWTEGFYSRSPKGNTYITTAGAQGCARPEKVDPKTVCQYTGLTDKNEKKIFEGDIVKTGGNLVVQWNEKFASWCLSKEGWMYNHFFGEAVNPEDCEVIGNIFDNPELLK